MTLRPSLRAALRALALGISSPGCQLLLGFEPLELGSGGSGGSGGVPATSSAGGASTASTGGAGGSGGGASCVAAEPPPCEGSEPCLVWVDDLRDEGPTAPAAATQLLWALSVDGERLWAAGGALRRAIFGGEVFDAVHGGDADLDHPFVGVRSTRSFEDPACAGHAGRLLGGTTEAQTFYGVEAMADRALLVGAYEGTLPDTPLPTADGAEIFVERTSLDEEGALAAEAHFSSVMGASKAASGAQVPTASARVPEGPAFALLGGRHVSPFPFGVAAPGAAPDALLPETPCSTVVPGHLGACDDGFLLALAPSGAPLWVLPVKDPELPPGEIGGAQAVSGVAATPDFAVFGGMTIGPVSAGEKSREPADPKALSCFLGRTAGPVGDGPPKIEWLKTFGSVPDGAKPAVDFLTSVAATKTGIAVAGIFRGAFRIGTGNGEGPPDLPMPGDGQLGVFVAFFTPDGTPKWSRTVAYAKSAFNLTRVAFDAAGGVIVAGHANASISSGEASFAETSGDHDGFIMKLDQDGTFVWRRLLGGVGAQFITTLALAPVGDRESLFMAGASDTEFSLEGGAPPIPAKAAFLARFDLPKAP